MQLLQERIRKEGKVLPGNIIKIDGFMNHRVDVRLMRDIAKEFGRLFDVKDVTLVLTAEASGIALATICAEEFGVPMVFAKKAKSDNIEGGLYQSNIYSYTYKRKVTLLCSQDWIRPSDKVLIIDDFLANGEALRGLVEIVEQSGATLVGMGVAVEKGFQDGGRKLRERGINLKSLAIIESADENGIVFREDEE
ncbi:MAG: xanthine phosphoribosyltransferase [Clostridia bacterium]|nr:xanthine phosphoribosyltransferase [Clostridia bacterium]